jgi:hypothetical protein
MGESPYSHDDSETSRSCPVCGLKKEAEGTENGEYNALVRHMVRKEDHPDETKTEALNRLKSGGGGSEQDAESPDEPASPADNEHTREGPGESVLTAAPPVMADGGSRECPGCESEMDSVNGSFPVVGQVDGETEKMVTEGGESYCPDCDIVTDGDTVMESARVDD